MEKMNIDLIGTQSSKQSITAGGNSVSSVIDCRNAKAIDVGMQAVFGGTPDGNAKLEVLTVLEGQADTVAYTVFEIDYSASQTLKKTIPITPNMLGCKIKISNLDSADAITVWGYIVITK